MEWLKHGVSNTHYFHVCANSKKRKNNTDRIRDVNGQLWTSTDDVGKAFFTYYTNLFSTGWEGDLSPYLQNIGTRVLDRMNMELVADFTMGEISDALN